MPILSQIGRKHPKTRALIALIYLALIVGGVTMVYPFALMISGSMKSASDVTELDMVPRFLHDDTALYRRYAEALFNERVDAFRMAYDSDAPTFRHVEPPPDPNPAYVRVWESFLEESNLPPHASVLGFMEAPSSRTVLMNLRRFKHELMRTYGRDLDRMNAELGTRFVSWNAFFLLAESYHTRLRGISDAPFQQAFYRFKAGRPPTHSVYVSLDGFYRNLLLKTRFTRDIAVYNAAHDTAYASYDEVRLPRHAGQARTPQERDTWEDYVRHLVNLQWVRIDAEAAPVYRAFLEAKHGSIDVLNRNYRTAYDAFDEIPLIEAPPLEGMALSDWDAFLKGWENPDTGETFMPAVEHLRLQSPDFLFHDYLAARFGSVERMNRELGTTVNSFDSARMPQQDWHYLHLLEDTGSWRREFAAYNFLAVIDYLVLHGRGFINTTIYCTLAVLLALLVNPLAAYAMSRYKMPSSYKLLLFMLLTMAFPPIVTQIPVFLMLRDFGMLNTFAALVLPGMAHGYSIFLLKGFFDSLPRELYESAAMDGANEFVMFWNITMSLSKPILAVIALSAFTTAYTNFMFALLICQDERMWTLMVWLYQLQQRSGQAVMYASLLVAAIPTFIIFFLCQNIILRGIVVPVEK